MAAATVTAAPGHVRHHTRRTRLQRRDEVLGLSTTMLRIPRQTTAETGQPCPLNFVKRADLLNCHLISVTAIARAHWPQNRSFRLPVAAISGQRGSVACFFLIPAGLGVALVPAPSHQLDQDLRRFLEAWASTWRTEPSSVATYVVPLWRPGEKANRDLHAKGVLVAGEGVGMLLCGSSNFSPHGMGVGMANVEANLCYVDDPNVKRGGLRLEDRLPVDWEQDICESPIWPETAEPIDDEQQSTNQPTPAAFLWAVYDQRSAILTVAMDVKVPLPTEWSLRWPGEGSEQTAPLLDHQQLPQSPPDGRAVLQPSASLRGANIAGLRIMWRDESGAMQSGILPVHVEASEDLLPPEEFRSLTASGIVECLLSGRDPAEWVAILHQRQSREQASSPRELDSLRAVDTSGYMLYRTRRLGAPWPRRVSGSCIPFGREKR